MLSWRNEGISIFDEKWDNLILLDACRYDIFRKFAEIDNNKYVLRKEISRGSHTIDFLEENFKKDYYSDIVYITANPHIDLMIKDKVYRVISVWKEDWNEKEKTVLPKTMFNYTLKSMKRFPNKKFIIHFIQPHYPYIGFHMDDSFKIFKDMVLNEQEIKIKKNIKDSLKKWYAQEIYSILDDKKLWKLYIHNFKLVFKYVNKLIKILPGKTIITSDHGEALGDKIKSWIPIRFYGHKTKFRIKPLIEIPWLEVLNKNYKNKKDSYEKSLILKGVKKIID